MSRDVDDLLRRLSPDDLQEIERLVEVSDGEWKQVLSSMRGEGEAAAPWSPLPGPQTMAYESLADVTGYGGAAGGGKTHLACGLALTKHQRVGIFRENGTELTAIIDDVEKIVGSRQGLNSTAKIWRLTRYDGRPLQVEFGSFPNPGDEQKYRGRPHDLLVFDEAAEMREDPVRFLMGWLRTTDPGQRCRALLCFNPPRSTRGRWILTYFAPWLDKKHPKPAQPGELRWFATVDDKDREVDGPKPFTHNGELITPTSRTFVPARLKDNHYLMGTGYMRQLMSMPEPLRSQLLYGDFQAGVEDDPMQVIPTAWVEAAMARWKRPDQLPPMDSLGVDVAMGGRDKTIIARRHGMWFDVPIVYPGDQCRDGATVAGFVTAAKRDGAVIHLDLFGVGAQPFGHLRGLGQQVIGVNVGEPATAFDRMTGRQQFANLRSQLWWGMREALDPNANNGIALPQSQELLADLCAPTWDMRGARIMVESREDILEKLGRSPDYGSAYVLGLMATPKESDPRLSGRRAVEHDPIAAADRALRQVRRPNDHNPLRTRF